MNSFLEVLVPQLTDLAFEQVKLLVFTCALLSNELELLVCA